MPNGHGATLDRAIAKAGGRRAFETQLKISRQRVDYWLKHGKVPSFELAREIERKFGVRFS